LTLKKNDIGGDTTSEIDIGKQVEKFWGRKDRQLNLEDEEEFQQMLQEIEEQFMDPTQVNPVKTVDFVKWLDPESILDVLKPSYSYFKYIKPRLKPRMRFFAYFMISKKKNACQAYHSLSNEEYILLGFTGKPTYEVLREFCYERIGVEQFPIILNWVVKETVFLLEKQGVFLGEETFQDATPVRSLKDDPDAKYSAYY
jgi:hypothetical protein